jgi:hypothetical protein
MQCVCILVVVELEHCCLLLLLLLLLLPGRGDTHDRVLQSQSIVQ